MIPSFSRFKRKKRLEAPLRGPTTAAAHGPNGVPPIPDTTKIGILKPLKDRDFALLWSGMTISLLGDGIFMVAIAFQTYAISNSPSALSLVFFAWTAPMVFFFLVAGVLTDRLDRRWLMIAADVIRGIAVGAMGLLSVTGNLELGHMVALSALYGVGDALFMPAFTAIVPEVVPDDLLVEANSLDQFVRPLTQRMLGPAFGGMLIAAAEPGWALIADSGSFVISLIAVALMSPRPRPQHRSEASALEEIKEGLRFVRSRTWLWGTLASASVGLLFFIGPLEVLIPYVVSNDMGGDAGDYGLILSVGGIGALAISFVMGQRGLPKRHITFMYSVWGVGVLLVATFALLTSVWQAMLVSLLMSAMFTAGMIVWGTLIHKLVPKDLMGRVSSLDWLVSTALVPVSFILTGPVADAIGVDATLIGAGVIGSVLTFAFLLLPGLKETESDGSLEASREITEVPELVAP